MSTKLSSDLKIFIESFCERMKIKNIDIGMLDLNTNLDMDLNIYDIDLDVFISDFSKYFGISVKLFDWGKQMTYPDGKDMNFLYIFFRSFNYKKKWVRTICKKLYKPKLFVHDFQKLLPTGLKK